MAKERVTQHIYLEDLDGGVIRFKNFEGVARPPYNAAGSRNFSVDIPDELVEPLTRDGWNIKPAVDKETEDGEIIHYPAHLKVNIKYNYEKNIVPRVSMDCRGKQIELNEETIHRLDDMKIVHVKGIDISPYNYEVNGSTGVSAYLNKMRVEVVPDMFAD